MRRILFFAVLAAIGFWVAWPAYSGYRINGALRGGDAASLGSTIDFDSVRASLRPAVGVEVEKRLSGALEKSGLGAAVLGGDVKKQLLPKIVDGVLVTMVTPQNVIRLYRDGGAAKDAISRIVAEEMAKSGGTGGVAGGPAGLGGVLGGLKKSPVRDVTNEPVAPSPADSRGKPDTTAAAAPPSYGLGNIKSFAFAGPLRMRVGVAKDQAAAVPDLTAELSFTGMDWKLTGLVPRS